MSQSKKYNAARTARRCFPLLRILSRPHLAFSEASVRWTLDNCPKQKRSPPTRKIVNSTFTKIKSKKKSTYPMGPHSRQRSQPGTCPELWMFLPLARPFRTTWWSTRIQALKIALTAITICYEGEISTAATHRDDWRLERNSYPNLCYNTVRSQSSCRQCTEECCRTNSFARLQKNSNHVHTFTTVIGDRNCTNHWIFKISN